MARVARHLHLVVFYDVLLDNGSSGLIALSLCQSCGVEVGLGDEAVVARNVVGGLGGAHGEVMRLVLHLL